MEFSPWRHKVQNTGNRPSPYILDARLGSSHDSQDGNHHYVSTAPQHPDNIPSPPVQHGCDLPGEGEPSKRVFTRRVWRLLGDFLLFHVPSAAITTLLLVLYISGFTWNPSPEQLSALLFAARLHESLIVASLFHILHYHVRRSLLLPVSSTRNGLSFGFLTSAFQLSSPFYMLSSSFWAPLISHGPDGISLSSLGFGALLIVCFLLTALAGASSSVVMLPRQGWHQVDIDPTSLTLRRNATRINDHGSGVGFIAVPVPFMSFSVPSVADLYPTVIQPTGLPQECLSDLPPFHCPAYNWAGERTEAFSWQLNNGLNLKSVRNISVALKSPTPGFGMGARSDAFETGRQIVSYQDLRESFPIPIQPGGSVAAATCPLAAANELLSSEGLTWQDISARVDGSPMTNVGPLKLAVKISTRGGENVPTKQPRVVIQCAREGEPPSGPKDLYPSPSVNDPNAGGTPNSTTNTWHFDRGFYPAMDLEVDNEGVFPYLPYGDVSGRGNSFIDVKRHVHLPQNLTVSAAFWLRGFRSQAYSNTYTVCLVDARWMESSETWAMPLQNALVTEHAVPLGASLAYTAPGSSRAEEGPIEITLDWLKMLDGTVRTRPRLTHVFDFDALLTNLASSVDTMAILLADALSRVPLSRGNWIESANGSYGDPANENYTFWVGEHGFTGPGEHVRTMTLSDLERSSNLSGDYAVMGVTYYHNMYGYAFDEDGEGMVRKLAWAVLLAHLVMIVGHFVVVMLVNGGWSSGAWGELGELLALALNSRPPEGGEHGRRLLANTGAGIDRWSTWRLKSFVREAVDEGKPSGRVELILHESGAPHDGVQGITTQADWKYG